MKFATIPFVMGTLAPAYAHHWEAPGPDDFRGPCPMMNTLANHAYLPHDGRDITRQKVIDGLGAALHFNSSLASLMFDMAIIANPEPNATYFTLDHLNRHNVLEHDASLSRTDAYFGSNHIFNQSIFDTSRAYWTEPVIDANMIANSKVARMIDSRATNPTYRFTPTVENFSLGEISAPFVAFGDLDAVTVDRDLVEYFFQNERLPWELGWTIRDEIISIANITKATEAIAKASTLLTPEDDEDSAAKRAVRRAALGKGLHWGF